MSESISSISKKSWIRNVASLIVLIGLMTVVRHYFPFTIYDEGYEATIMLLGFILLASYLMGLVVSAVGLPKITGYLITGILFGPTILGYATPLMVSNLKIINGMAVALIALTAGGEIKLNRIKHIKRPLFYISLISMLLIFSGVFIVAVLIGPGLSFLGFETSWQMILAVALLLATISMASSPTVAIAVINDTDSKGRVSDLILGTTVIKDMAVILTFAVAVSVAVILDNPSSAFNFSSILISVGEVGLSLILGLFLGWLLGIYLKKVGHELVLVVLGFCLLVAEIGLVYHLEPLSICLATGFYLENYSGHKGDELITAIKKLSLPVYAVFFSVIGLGLKLGMLVNLWTFALLFVGIRLLFTYLGTMLGAKVGKATPKMMKYGWMGFISQAGVSLGLAVTISRTFPKWGPNLETLIISVVTIHEIIGPVFLKYTLDKAGETAEKRFLKKKIKNIEG